MGYSKYPGELDDSTTLPPSTDLITPVKAEVVNRLRDALLAVEFELGAMPSSVFGTVADRLNGIRAQLTTVASDLNIVEAELGANPSGSFDTVAARLASIAADLSVAIVDISVLGSELGANPSGGFADVEARLDNVDGLIALLIVDAEVVVPIVSGNQETDLTIDDSVGGCMFNPTNLGYPAATFVLEVILQTTNVTVDGYFQLYNFTDGYNIAHAEIRTTSLIPEFISVSLTVGGSDLTASQNNILDGRIRLASGAAAIDRCIIKYAAIRITPT